jgi:hypothetical protein
MAPITERLDPMPFSPGPQGTLLVQLAVLARGAPEPDPIRVGAAWIAMGARDATVGQVAEHVIARGHPLDVGGQLQLLG